MVTAKEKIALFMKTNAHSYQSINSEYDVQVYSNGIEMVIFRKNETIVGKIYNRDNKMIFYPAKKDLPYEVSYSGTEMAENLENLPQEVISVLKLLIK